MNWYPYGKLDKTSTAKASWKLIFSYLVVIIGLLALVAIVLQALV